MHPKRYIVAIILILAVLVACTPAAEPTPTAVPQVDREVLTISGSGSITPILSAIRADFENDNMEIALEVLPGSGTGGGVRGLIDEVLDIAAMSREPRDSEAEEGVRFVAFGRSNDAFITHPDVTVTELTAEQVTDIFAGNITNWSEVGGEDQAIIVFVRDPEEGNTVRLREAYLGDIEFPENVTVPGSQTEMQESVSSVEGAIGYGTWATVLANEAQVSPLTIDGLSPNDEDFPANTALGIGYLESHLDDVEPLITWLSSEDGQAALNNIGVLPLSE